MYAMVIISEHVAKESSRNEFASNINQLVVVTTPVTVKLTTNVGLCETSFEVTGTQTLECSHTYEAPTTELRTGGCNLGKESAEDDSSCDAHDKSSNN